MSRKLVCPPEEDKTRQEFLPETDVRYQLAKFGYGRPLVFTEVDYSMDLLLAKSVVAEADASFARLPEEIRAKYGSWSAVISALQDGSLSLDKASAEGEDSPRPDADADAGSADSES